MYHARAWPGLSSNGAQVPDTLPSVPPAAQPAVEVGDISPEEISVAVAVAVEVLARGMRDNPLPVVAFGADPERRWRLLERQFAALFRVMSQQMPICAVDEGTIVGAAGIAPPGTCRPSQAQRLRFLPAAARAGPRGAGRFAMWVGAWAKRDPDEPHSHLGPLAVDAHLQRRGIGEHIMREYERRLDDSASSATSRPTRT